jgi:thiamine monophosphate kinase
MPVGIGEVNPAEPQTALRASSLSLRFAGNISVRDSLAGFLPRFLLRFFQGDLVGGRGPRWIDGIIAQGSGRRTAIMRHAQQPKRGLVTAGGLSEGAACFILLQPRKRFVSVVTERASYNGSIEASQASSRKP